MSNNITPAQSLHRTFSMRSLQTIEEDMEGKQLVGIKDQTGSHEASPKLAEANDGSEFMMITVGHCHNIIPAPKYHAEMNMTSRPQMSQKEYEGYIVAKHDLLKSVMANNNGSALLAKAEDDEIITIVCKHDAASSLTLLTSKRSALQRSPMLAKFFRSSDYLVGSGTQLEFHETSVACLRVIKEYLEDGPDLYTKDTLRSYATQETASRKVYDFLLLVYVHKLAVKLELNSLMHLAYAVLFDLESSVTPRDCINLIDLVFNTNHHFNNALQNWFLERVDRHFDFLSVSCEWANAMVKSSTEFKVLWADVTLRHLRPTPTTSATSEETKASLPTFMKPLPAAPAIVVTDTTSEATVLDDSSDDEYHEPQDYARGRSSDQENAKARRVLGINDDGGGFIAGRIDKKKPSGFSRASKSLMGLMKRD